MQRTIINKGFVAPGVLSFNLENQFEVTKSTYGHGVGALHTVRSKRPHDGKEHIFMKMTYVFNVVCTLLNRMCLCIRQIRPKATTRSLRKWTFLKLFYQFVAHTLGKRTSAREIMRWWHFVWLCVIRANKPFSIQRNKFTRFILLRAVGFDVVLFSMWYSLGPILRKIWMDFVCTDEYSSRCSAFAFEYTDTSQTGAFCIEITFHFEQKIAAVVPFAQTKCNLLPKLRLTMTDRLAKAQIGSSKGKRMRAEQQTKKTDARDPCSRFFFNVTLFSWIFICQVKHVCIKYKFWGLLFGLTG